MSPRLQQRNGGMCIDTALHRATLVHLERDESCAREGVAASFMPARLTDEEKEDLRMLRVHLVLTGLGVVIIAAVTLVVLWQVITTMAPDPIPPTVITSASGVRP